MKIQELSTIINACLGSEPYATELETVGGRQGIPNSINLYHVDSNNGRGQSIGSVTFTTPEKYGVLIIEGSSDGKDSFSQQRDRDLFKRIQEALITSIGQKNVHYEQQPEYMRGYKEQAGNI